MAPRHIFLILAITVVWGNNFVVTKIGVDAIPPIFFSALRFSFVAVVLLPWLKIARGKMIDVSLIALFGGVLSFTLGFVGMHLADDVSPVAIVVQLGVPFSVILAVIFLGERIGWKRSMGIVLAFIGVLIMGFDPRVFGYIEAVSFTAASALCFAIATILMRRLQGVGVFQLQAWIAVLSLLPMFAASYIFEQNQIPALMAAGWLGPVTIGYSALGGTVLGQSGMFFLLQRYTVTVISPYMLLPPFMGVLAGVLFLNDQLTLRAIMGGLVTLAGVTIITLRTRKIPPPTTS